MARPLASGQARPLPARLAEGTHQRSPARVPAAKWRIPRNTLRCPENPSVRSGVLSPVPSRCSCTPRWLESPRIGQRPPIRILAPPDPQHCPRRSWSWSWSRQPKAWSLERRQAALQAKPQPSPAQRAHPRLRLAHRGGHAHSAIRRCRVAGSRPRASPRAPGAQVQALKRRSPLGPRGPRGCVAPQNPRALAPSRGGAAPAARVSVWNNWAWAR